MANKLAWLWKVGLGFSFLLFAFQMGRNLSMVPGVHYDEAWFADFAQKIANLPSFWPLHGMNGYTVPITAYVVAGAFKISGPSFEIQRLVFLAFNLLNWILLISWVYRVWDRKAALMTSLLLACLPFFIFTFRLFIEVTTFHVFFLLILLWGAALWKSCPRTSFGLLLGGALLGFMTHILFLGVILGFWFTAFFYHKEEALSRRGRFLVLWAGLFISVFLFSFHDGLNHSASLRVFLLASLILLGSLLVFFSEKLPAWKMLEQALSQIHRVVMAVALIPWLWFLGMEWSGFWPISQPTGKITWPWWQLGALAFLFLFFKFYKNKKQGRQSSSDIRISMLWSLISWILLFTVISAFKLSSARYWTLAGVLCAVLFSILFLDVFKNLSSARWRGALIALFLLILRYGLLQSETGYFQAIENQGARHEEFQWLHIRESPVDYRPFHRVWLELVQRGCSEIPITVDYGRNEFVLRVDQEFQRFRRVTTSSEKTMEGCPYRERAIFLGKPPQEAAYGRLYEKRPEWGDVEIWGP